MLTSVSRCSEQLREKMKEVRTEQQAIETGSKAQADPITLGPELDAVAADVKDFEATILKRDHPTSLQVLMLCRWIVFPLKAEI
jgi:hypothetical protein